MGVDKDVLELVVVVAGVSVDVGVEVGSVVSVSATGCMVMSAIEGEGEGGMAAPVVGLDVVERFDRFPLSLGLLPLFLCFFFFDLVLRNPSSS